MDVRNEIEYGCIITAPLVSFAADDPEGLGIFGRTKEGKEFARIVRDLVPHNINVSGFYCWGSFSVEGVWQPVYVGQSHDLERRLLEGLKHERIAFWVQAGFSEDQFIEKGHKYYPEKWGEYKRGWERCVKKASATHVIWVKTRSLAHLRLELIESELIRKWQPPGNTQNTDNLRRLNEMAKQEIRNYTEQVAAAFENAAKQYFPLPRAGSGEEPHASGANGSFEKASYLVKYWGHKFKEHGFGPNSTLGEYDGLLSLIERFGGFDPDDLETELYGDEEVFKALQHVLAEGVAKP